MNNLGKERVAALLAQHLGATQVRAGESSQAPSPEDTALAGAQVGAGNGTLVAEGVHVKLSAVIPLSADETVAEAGLFTAAGDMLDRWVFGPLTTAKAGSLVVQYDLEVR